MRKAFLIVALGAAALMTANAAQAAVLEVLPVTGHDLDYLGVPQLTDNASTLTYNNTTGNVEGTETKYGGLGSYDWDRYGYFDFGTDWASLRIVETWSFGRASVPSSPDTPTGFNQLWWSTTPTKGFDSNDGDVAETTLNFFLHNNVAQKTWYNDVALTPTTAVTPQGRYLIVKVAQKPGFANPGTFSEIAFVGSVVPEPASVSLLGLGGLALLAHRRSRA